MSRPCNIAWCVRKDSLICRLIRLRVTAFVETRRDTTTPIRALPSRQAAVTRKSESRVFRPPRRAASKSAGRPRRSVRASPSGARAKGLRAHTCPTLRATSINNSATTDGAHSGSETVRALSFEHSGLISTFHGRYSFLPHRGN